MAPCTVMAGAGSFLSFPSFCSNSLTFLSETADTLDPVSNNTCHSIFFVLIVITGHVAVPVHYHWIYHFFEIFVISIHSIHDFLQVNILRQTPFYYSMVSFT